MTTAVQVQYRRDTASNVAAFTGAVGEIVVDTTRNRPVVQDGATAGGFPIAKITDAQGYGFIPNCGLTAAISANNLTISLVTASGGNPSAANSIFVPFRNATLATGTPSFVEITAALSIQIASGDTLGTANSVPFRFWIVLFNNGGTPVLGAINCRIGGASPTAIIGLDDGSLVSPNSTIGNSAGVLYSGAAVSANSAMRILGYIDYGSGLATAGTYNSGPTKTQLFGPGVAKPGHLTGNQAYALNSAGTVGNGAFQSTGMSVALTPASAANLVRVQANGNYGTGGGAQGISHKISRGAGPTYIGPVMSVNLVTGGVQSGTLSLLDAPASTSAVTYYLYFNGSNSSEFNFAGSSTMEAWEVQG